MGCEGPFIKMLRETIEEFDKAVASLEHAPYDEETRMSRRCLDEIRPAMESIRSKLREHETQRDA
jgi:hypothetical protein